MKEFTWKIQEVNAQAGTMVVEYSYSGLSRAYNIPMPTLDANVNDWVKSYAPVSEWERMDQVFANVEEGMEGTCSLDHSLSEAGNTEVPNVMGSWQEEYLRALIYQILEEIREAQV